MTTNLGPFSVCPASGEARAVYNIKGVSIACGEGKYRILDVDEDLARQIVLLLNTFDELSDEEVLQVATMGKQMRAVQMDQPKPLPPPPEPSIVEPCPADIP